MPELSQRAQASQILQDAMNDTTPAEEQTPAPLGSQPEPLPPEEEAVIPPASEDEGPLLHPDGTPLTEEEIATLPPEEDEAGELDIDSLPRDAKGRAEALGLDPSFFYDMEYTMKDGTVLSVGAMKDKLTDGGVNFEQQQDELNQKQRQFEATLVLNEQFGEPIRQHEAALKQLQEKYKTTNWKELTDEYGDKAELAKVQMQQRYSQIENELANMKGQYGQAMQNFQVQISQEVIHGIVSYHPEWKDPEVAKTALGQVHDGIKDLVSLEEMTQIVSTMGLKALKVFERAATGGKVTNIDQKRVRKAAAALKGGRTISAQQQQKMQMAKRIKAAAENKNLSMREKAAAIAKSGLLG